MRPLAIQALLIPFVAAFIGLFATPAEPVVYAVEDLGTLGGTTSHASALNIAGQVVGWSTTVSGAKRAFLYSDGAMTDLGTLSGGSYSFATGISDTGHIVGYSGIDEHGPQFREARQAFLWDAGQMRSLGALYCPCTFNDRYGTSAAYGVNANGDVVGESGTLRGVDRRHAFLWHDEAMRDLEPEPVTAAISYAYAINEHGQVVGRSDNHATMWHNGDRQDLGTLAGHESSVARAVNRSGHVVGESIAKDAAASRAFLWLSGTVQDLGTLPGDQFSQANGINAYDQIVGSSTRAEGAESRAFLWQNGAMSELNRLVSEPGWTLTTAEAINDSGQIVGAGQHNGQRRAFRLTPKAR